MSKARHDDIDMEIARVGEEQVREFKRQGLTPGRAAALLLECKFRDRFNDLYDWLWVREKCDQWYRNYNMVVSARE